MCKMDFFIRQTRELDTKVLKPGCDGEGHIFFPTTLMRRAQLAWDQAPQLGKKGKNGVK